MNSFNFSKIKYGNWMTSGSKSFDQVFLKDDGLNRGIYKNYYNVKFQSSPLGVYELDHVNSIGEWGALFDQNRDGLLGLKGIGWFEAAYQHMAVKMPNKFAFNESGFRYVKDGSPIIIDNNCAMLSFPGALTYGHWIVDIVFRYEFLCRAKLIHKIDKFILPESLGSWSNIFLEFLNIDEDDIIRISNEKYYHFKKIFVPTVASFLPGGTLPNNIAVTLFDELRSFLLDQAHGTNSSSAEVAFLKHTPVTSNNDRLVDLSIIEEYIVSIGGVIIDPMKYSLPELAKILTNTKLIIGQDSSALHNNAFIGADMIVIESEPRENLLHVSIQDVLGKKIQYIRCKKNSNGYYLDIEEIKESVESLINLEFGDRVRT